MCVQKNIAYKTSPGADMSKPNIHVGQSLQLSTFIVRF